jgi:superfamily II DNA or RNA helicase
LFKKPRLYQQDIINKTLETTKSTLIQLPTGGGKTIISKEIAIGLINNFNKKILFIAPKIVLMEQTLETFKGLKPQKVHGSNNKFDKNHNILISTLQTASRRNSLNPDVIIIDEVHFGYEKKMLNKIMEYNPNARIIGLSATPFDENGYPFKGFDVIINDYDLVYMIKHKFLVPLRSYILVKPDLTDVDIIAGDYEINQLSKAVSKNTIIMEIVATSKPYIKESIKTIVFAVDINHAELLKTAFQNEGFITEALHSKSEKDDSEVIERFKRGYIKVLVSVLKLTTGFDVPETDLAIIARPTKSQNLYKQMVGRVLRIAPNKKNAILLDCGNVIGNLGKPLEPIIPKDELEKKIQKLKCKHCESENIKLKKSNSNMYWECQDCGFIKDLENKNHYKCKNCNKKYSYQDGDFELVNNKLYLNCECGFETEISIATGDEEFREVDSGIDISVITEKIDKDIVPLNKYKNLTVENIYMFFNEIKSYENNEAYKIFKLK